ncbi:MAG: nodulation protein NfeD [Alphaproteobacteria bacterium]|nr:nodulation protein NfeD [Alphaproteobacteria bacterium]
MISAWRSVMIALVLLASAGWPARAETVAHLLSVDGAIGPAITDYVLRGIENAERDGARLVVLRLDTPGGLDSAMRDIIRGILHSPIPVVTWVAPSGARAASAGTYILYASHAAVMAPATNLGAATPVSLGGGGAEGKDSPPSAMERKAVNDAVAYIRGLAEMRGRNADWAERAVREAVSLTASDALRMGVIDAVARDIDAVLAAVHGMEVSIGGRKVAIESQGARVERIEPDWRTRFLATITDPNVAYLLLMIGLYGVIFELANPGAVFPGVIGGIALLVGLFALNLLPIDYAGVGLVLLGICLMVGEAFMPSFGILGLGGAIAFAFGSVMMFDRGVPGFQVSPVVVGLATLSALGLFALVLSMLARSRRRPVVSGREAMLGSIGHVTDWAEGHGAVRVHGERWQARSGAALSPGQRVRVAGLRGLELDVEPAEEENP